MGEVLALLPLPPPSSTSTTQFAHGVEPGWGPKGSRCSSFPHLSSKPLPSSQAVSVGGRSPVPEGGQALLG